MSIGLCIPAYNAAHFLPALLADARNQTQPFDEVWVHDDASSDDTADVAQTLGAQVIRSESNVGCALGKHRMLEQSGCELVHFHDADDRLMPSFVEASQRAMHPDIDVLMVAFENRDLDSDQLLGTCRFDHGLLRTDPIAYSISHQLNNSGVYRRDAILAAGGFRIAPDQLYNEDQAFHCRLARAGLKFDALTEVQSVIYRVPGSMSAAARLKCVQAQIAVMAEAAQASDSRYHRAIAVRLWQIAAVAASLKGWPDADRAALLAASLHQRGPEEGHAAYRWLAARAPRLAIRVREKAIHLLGKRSIGAES